MLRSAQKHYSEGVSKMEEAVIYSIKVTDLCLASHTARSLFGTKHLPILDTDDPIRAKFICRAHTLGPGGSRGTHQFGKTTLANVISGEIGVIWEKCKTEVQAFKRMCGICRRFSKENVVYKWGIRFSEQSLASNHFTY